jgi:hypothetical protein
MIMKRSIIDVSKSPSTTETGASQCAVSANGRARAIERARALQRLAVMPGANASLPT